MYRSPRFLIAALIVVALIVVGLTYQWLPIQDPLATRPFDTYLPPSPQHWFGTDKFGRDVFARVLAGSRTVIIIALLAAAISVLVGGLIGFCAGYFQGILDDVVSRVIDAILAVPTILIALAVVVAVTPTPIGVGLIIGLIFSAPVSRTFRSGVLAETSLEYVAQAKLRGEPSWYVMLVEILPNMIPVVVVEFSVRTCFAIFVAASLSFLGFGVQPPTPDWGLMINEEYQQLIAGIWWPTLFPALAIALLVTSMTLLTEQFAEVIE
ncbi:MULTISPECIES: ABC transporter permease [unclassified Mesorhizobium]|uniref:ABC transporter permease n=1 Tax=unclassified Mesorhizobium TaxID=325217 RepID=UPI00109302FE|nr:MULTISPECIES: ABC transporter permease [unclassified Mesorhizobium]TGS43735.1 ABC transporter permease [Mesorhizobium sp. M8A.F.Ca.ET.182.01.1.1]TGS78316.1 ABC transporter permease [Mesorhizobium sp. M8A.F.Ca.ET.181.01.1.1]TGV15455.1 ABC transporter permease [Mesorhizobium sp. M8A.F.Ca.ET.173.01.1.1]